MFVHVSEAIEKNEVRSNICHQSQCPVMPLVPQSIPARLSTVGRKQMITPLGEMAEMPSLSDSIVLKHFLAIWGATFAIKVR